MIVFPNCKINLGLQVLRKRPDGYHDLQTIFYPVALHDVLESVPSDSFHFEQTGSPIAGEQGSNLCVKAWQLLKEHFPQMPDMSLHLHKAIPMGAGLGGGSADGSFTLRLLNDQFSLGLDERGLIELALQLGSDCPFFIMNRPVLATGRGEKMTPVDIDLSRLYIVLLHPGIHVSTAEAFAGITPRDRGLDLAARIMEPIETWKDWLTNDFEATVFGRYPEIAEAKRWLYEQGAVYASMTGSGSSVYGIFRNEPEQVGHSSWKTHVIPVK
jgi:4-diphosphocytidyl-2-C-methyl-D-erythritol kinase